jgi:hypothetical protein
MCKRVLRKRAHAHNEVVKRQKIEADLAELMLCASRAFEERQAEAKRQEDAMKHQAEQEILLKFIATGNLDDNASESSEENSSDAAHVTRVTLECPETIDQSEPESYLDMIRKFKDYDPVSYVTASEVALAQWYAGFRVRAWNAHYDAVAAGKAQPFECYRD